MTEFVVRLDNRPGSFARVAEVLAQAGVNIEALAAWGLDGDGLARLIVDDAPGARRALEEAGLNFDEHRILTTGLPNRPGELAKVARSLADAGINIDALYVLRSTPGMVEIALAVDEPDEAAPHLPVRGGASP